MTDTQFTVFRWLAIPAAMVIAANWFTLSSSLRLADAIETTATVKTGTFKGQRVAYLQTAKLGEVRVECSNAPQLCNAKVCPPRVSVKVWLQTPGPLHWPWVVAAEREGSTIITPEMQAPIYRKAKFVWAIGTLAAVLIGFMLWYAAPYKRALQGEA
ncbi:hypothetical protein AACH06_29280 [Ideonella sp. DXS29W]|uniref:DUF3592 domain-containing protein n=1 Tax=Ideonella lacteola TaxID=2984193 RepID=A0ABU9BY78_9BURK